MSRNRDMRPYMLQKKVSERTASGAERETWIDISFVDAAVYKKNDLRISGGVKYTEATHTGVTRCKDLAEGYRLLLNGVVYNIVDCNAQSRWTNLILKVVTDRG